MGKAELGAVAGSAEGVQGECEYEQHQVDAQEDQRDAAGPTQGSRRGLIAQPFDEDEKPHEDGERDEQHRKDGYKNGQGATKDQDVTRYSFTSRANFAGRPG